ncbi:MAG: ATP synthase F1 subunit epsilon [Erysipelotrichaceae bacterium]|jgi:F-type H+-transporting ATPase subunit epsilon
MSTLHVRIVTPKGIYKEFDTPILNIQTTEGDQGILPEHMPLVTMLKVGKMTSDEDGKREIYAVASGLFYFRDNTAEILTDAIENKEDIDLARAEAARERAEKRLSSNDPNIDLRRAQIALQKAVNRINIKSQ